MANNENSKYKTLCIFDYFLNHVDGSSIENNKVLVKDITNYLSDVLGSTFERKSIYSDIDRINEFVRLIGKSEDDQDWITREGHYYVRGPLKDELTSDEAKLIVDAIRTTAFVDSGICDKMMNLFPVYFKNYRSLYPRENSMGTSQLRKINNMLNTIRDSIDCRSSIKIQYGYRFCGGFRGIYDVNVSPLALDWENNCYYLIAFDNSKYDKEDKGLSSLRKYRLDRIVTVNFDKSPYNDVPNSNFLKKYLSSTLNAFSSNQTKEVDITIKFDDEKTCLRAYSSILNHIEIKRILEDKVNTGEVTFRFSAPIISAPDEPVEYAPTIYPMLFDITHYQGFKSVIIHDSIMKAAFYQHLKSAISILEQT